MRPNLIILESSDIAASYIALAARNLGFEPVFLCHMDSYQADTRAQIKSFIHHDIAGFDLHQITALVANSGYNVAGVVTLSDSALHNVEELANSFDCIGLDSAATQLKDKANVVKLIPEYSPKSILFSRDFCNLTQLEQFLESCPSGIVVKPRFGSGAMGFHRISASEELGLVLSQIKKLQIRKNLYPDLWIAQEAINGELVSCEGYVLNGITRFLGFTGSSKIGNTQSKSYFPYDSHLSSSELSLAHKAVNILIERSNFKRGYFHIEFLLDGQNTKLIDANIGRLGGGSIGDHISISANINPINLYRHFIEVSLFNKESFKIDSSQMHSMTKSYLYGSPESIKLIKLEYKKSNENCHHTQLLDNNSYVPSMGLDNWAWIGILTGKDEILEKEFTNIKLVTDKGIITPIC